MRMVLWNGSRERIDIHGRDNRYMQSNAIDISPCYIRSYSDGRRGERPKALHSKHLRNMTYLSHYCTKILLKIVENSLGNSRYIWYPIRIRDR